MIKKMDKKAFTLIELIVVIAVVGILVLLGIPRFTGHKDRVELTRIQHDVKVMEQEIGTEFINKDDDFDNWENNNKDFNQLIQEGKLFEKEGIAKEVESTDETYKVVPEKYKDKINTKLKGTFYANSGGKVYYEHTKPLGGIPTEPEKTPEYSNEKIQDLINDGYIPVATAEELNNVRNTTLETYGKGTKWEGEYEGGLDKKYIQVLNIDLSVYSGDGWNPIGNDSSVFTGTYDGGNYVITGLEVKGEGKRYQGLFGRTNGATISNVGLIDNKVTGTNSVGGLVGMAESNKISNSYATGSVTGSGESVGGLVGYAWSSTISNSYAKGSVKGDNQVGGLVGYASASGMHRVTISNSYSTGSVTGADNVGGLVGQIFNNAISNSYTTGSVEGSGSYVGGLVGAAYYNSTIDNSYTIGSVIGSGDYVGGLVGKAHISTISNSYTTGLVKGSEIVGGLMGGTFENTMISNSYATGPVESEDHAGGLVGAAHSSTKIIDSYATGSVTGSECAGGLVGAAYSSSEISNSYATGEVTGSGWKVGGLVGLAQSNSTISNSYAKGSVKGDNQVGGLVGWVYQATVSNSYSIGEVAGADNVGGLVGKATVGTIENSYATGEVTGTGNNIGGFVGWANNSSEISNSYSIGLVKGSGENVGGLVGSTKYLDEYEFSSTISNSYWDVGTSGQSSSDGGTGMTTDEMKKQTTYSGWDFDTAWKIDEGNDYPELR